MGGFGPPEDTTMADGNGRGMKRHTAEKSGVRALDGKAFTISKNDWIVLYTDLYRQTHGADASALMVYNDAIKRLAILKANGLV